jgi:Pvc16 N-terminal domain
MSNSQAIAAVTSCLQQIVMGAFVDGDHVDVTTKTLDKPAATASSRRLNLFLYSVAPSGAWRNRDLPTQKPGERGRPPLALTLQYLLTAYADDEVESHKLLGEAVGALNDHPVLLPSELSTPPGVSSQPNAGFERVHVTLQPMSIEDLSKLWSAFQSQYRLSVAYEASVAIIESRLETPAALPVLHVGPESRGPFASATMSRVPILHDFMPRTPRASETVTLVGQQLAKIGDAAGKIAVVFSRLGEEVRRIPNVKAVAAADLPFALPLGFSAIQFALPSGAASLAAGPYDIRVQVTVDDELGRDRTYTSNEMALPIAPRIAALTPTTVRATASSTLKVTCEPAPAAGQRVRLLLGTRELAPSAASGTTLSFILKPVKPGEDALEIGQHTVRLRVDGVDSLRVVRSASGLEFERPDVLTVTS